MGSKSTGIRLGKRITNHFPTGTLTTTLSRKLVA